MVVPRRRERQKKAGVIPHAKVWDHVGLLIDRPFAAGRTALLLVFRELQFCPQGRVFRPLGFKGPRGRGSYSLTHTNDSPILFREIARSH